MHPMVSPIDHEARHSSSNRAEDEPSPSESTPLLPNHQFVPSPRERRTFIFLALLIVLMLILVTGAGIGIYLLVIQQDSTLPPVEGPLQLVSYDQWVTTRVERGLYAALPPARHVVIVQTDTEECYGTEECRILLQRLQTEPGEVENCLSYNFLISSNGQTYEALGWGRPSTLFPDLTGSALVLALIGNFTTKYPSREQLAQAKTLCDESVSQRHLIPSYTIIGKSRNGKSNFLFKALKELGQWDWTLSDPL